VNGYGVLIDHAAAGDEGTNTKYVPRKDYADKPLDARTSTEKNKIRPAADANSPPR